MTECSRIATALACAALTAGCAGSVDTEDNVTSAIALASVAPAPTYITVKPGTTEKFELYDATNYAEPYADTLTSRGFNHIFIWDNHTPKLSWFNPDVAPSPALVDGSSQMTDIENVAKNICPLIDPDNTTLVVLDAEWPLYTVPAGTLGPMTEIPTAVNSLALVLKWLRQGFAASTCASRVRLGAYGIVPTNWNVLYTGRTPAEDPNVKSWFAFVQAVVTATKPFVDFWAPSFYAPWGPESDAGIGNHVTAWQTTVNETLTQPIDFGLPIIPFLGLRYYHDSSATYQNHFVEESFFATMLQTVTASKYALEGAIYWDWSSFGGVGYANDGTNVWSESDPWLVATKAQFNLETPLPLCAVEYAANAAYYAILDVANHTDVAAADTLAFEQLYAGPSKHTCQLPPTLPMCPTLYVASTAYYVANAGANARSDTAALFAYGAEQGLCR